MESRDVPCWTLILRQDTTVSLKSTGQAKKQPNTPFEIHIVNGSLKDMLLCIASYHQDEMPFIDETGIDYPVDIQIDALLNDLPEVQQALRRNGLELIKKKRPMKVIVVRDPVVE